jgi:HPt (histidine-containing phosphotransfer) domain-containing protein
MIADLRYLNSLMGYDATRTQKFIEIYKSEIPKQMDLLLAHIDNENYNDVGTIAHGIKSQSAYLMAEDVVKIARHLESEAEQVSDPAALRTKAMDLQDAVARVLRML